MQVIIIGGGIAGISAAIRLKKNGIESLIIEKEKVLGGRINTHKINFGIDEEIFFDVGAPHFSVKSQSFEEMVMFLISNFVIQISDKNAYYPPTTFYRGTKNMMEPTDFLSSGLEFVSGKEVVFLNPAGRSTEVICGDGSSFFGNAVIFTLPIPQILDLFNKSSIKIPHKLAANLKTIHYEKILSAMLVVEGKSNIPRSGFKPVNKNGIKFIIDNTKRKITKGKTSLTITADERFSENNFFKSDEQILSMIEAKARDFFEGGILYSELKRWRYAYPKKFYKKSFEFINSPSPFILAGDAFLNGKVEGGFLSGKTAAEYLIGQSEGNVKNFTIAGVRN